MGALATTTRSLRPSLNSTRWRSTKRIFMTLTTEYVSLGRKQEGFYSDSSCKIPHSHIVKTTLYPRILITVIFLTLVFIMIITFTKYSTFIASNRFILVVQDYGQIV